jgi:hypothetical protein
VHELRYPFILAVLAGALLTSVVLFVLPRAWVTIQVAAEPLATDVTLILDTSATIPRQEDGVLPARHLRVEEIFEREAPIETIQEQGNRAVGAVDLVNTLDTPQGIKAGTRLVNAQGVVVRVQRGAIIPGHGRSLVNVVADQGGTAGNLSPQRLTMPGLSVAAQRILFGEVVTPLSGGSTHPVRVLGPEDLDRATQILRADADTRLRTQLRAEQFSHDSRANAGQQLLDRDELLRVSVEVLETTPSLGAEGTTVHLRARVSAEALTTKLDDLRQFLADIVRTRAGPGKDIQDAPNLNDLHVVSVDWGRRTAELSLHVETTALPSPLLGADLGARLAGRTPEGAEHLLKGLPGVREITVVLSPVWVRRVPTNPRNIHIRRVLIPARRTGP